MTTTADERDDGTESERADDRGEETTGSPRRRHDGLALAAIVCALVFVVSAAVFVVLELRGGTSDTPADATNHLFAAANDRDVLAGIDALAPSERDLVRSSVPDAAAQLQRLGLLSSAQVQPVPGASVSTDNLHYTTTSLSSTIAAVDVDAGRIELRGDAGSSPLTDAARGIVKDELAVDVGAGTATRDFAQYPFRLMTVNEGGHWYVSAAYTLAENLRPARPDDAPAYGRGPAPVGATSAEAAVRQLVERYAAADAPGAVALIEPDEARVYADYVALLTPVDPKVTAERNKGKDPRLVPLEDRMGIVKTVSLDKLELATEGTGATARVRVTALNMVIHDEVQDELLAYDGTCLSVRYRFGTGGSVYKRYNSCTPGTSSTTASDPSTPGTTAEIGPDGQPNAGKSPEEIKRELAQAGGTPPADNPISTLALFGGGGQLPAVTVVQRDGRWYVSPVRSLVTSTLDTLRDMSPDRVRAFAGRVHRAIDRTPTDLAEEARDPDNSLFGPSATANNRLVASCFVEIAMTAGEGAAAEHTAECVKTLVDSGKIRPEAGAANLLKACYSVQPEAPPALDDPYRRLYLTSRAQRACFRRLAKSGGLPDYAIANLDKPLDQPCVAPYEALTATSPEAAWVDADAKVAACLGATGDPNP